MTEDKPEFVPSMEPDKESEPDESEDVEDNDSIDEKANGEESS